jgi:hypothetical protein
VSEQSGRYQRSPGGLLAARVVLVVLVIGYVAVQALLRPDGSAPQQRVDYAPVVPQARKAAHFAVVAPTRLPAGWRATSVRFTPGPVQRWHLGVLTDRGRYVGLEQGRQSVREVVDRFVDPAAVRGRPVVVRGATWATYTDSGGDLALVRHAERTTTLVVGHAVSRSQLRSYTARLR